VLPGAAEDATAPAGYGGLPAEQSAAGGRRLIARGRIAAAL